MIGWKRGCAVAACMLLACCKVMAEDVDSLADAATAAPLHLKLTDHFTLSATDLALMAQPGDAVIGDVSLSSKVAGPTWPPSSRQEFIAAIWPHAERAAREIGVTPHALAAQAALESGWGQRVATNADGQPTFNLFGIKAGSSWDGDRVEIATHEYVRGKRRLKIADFRAYESIAECFADYVAMLKANPRYASALRHGGTSRHFAARLQRAGYSTDPHYAAKVHDIANSALVKSAKQRRRASASQRIAERE